MKRYILGVVSLLSVLNATAQLKPQYQLERAKAQEVKSEFVTTLNPDIPTSVTFAGEKVSFDRLDMADRLDRELTSIIYAHTSTLLCIKRANRYFPALSKILREQNIPQDFLYLACTASTMDPLAYSPAAAAGTWQLLAATGRQYGLQVDDEVDERYDPERSTVAACKYLKAAYARYGNWATVAASYNAGMGRITSELGKQGQKTSFDLYLNQETSRYVFRSIAFKLFMEEPQKYGYRIKRKHLYQPVGYTTENVTASVDSWVDWAKAHNITYAQLREANPWIRASKLTNKSGKTYKVRIPIGDDLYRSKRKFTVYNAKWVID